MDALTCVSANSAATDLFFTPFQMVLSAQDEAEMKAQRIKRRVVELISKAAAASSSSSSSSSSGQVSLSYTSSSISSTSTSPAASASALARGVESSATAAAAAEVATESTSLKKHLHFQFYRSPVEVLTDGSGAACGMRVERTKLAMPADGSAPRAVGTGEFEELEAQLVLKSIGYRSLPLEGVPFDASRGVVPNSGGRVVSSSSGGGDVGHGLYVCGWLKRGPTGIIGTNLVDAEETVECLAADASSPGRLPRVEQQPAGSEGLARLLDAQRVRHVTWAQWLNVDEAEVGSGRQQGRVRDKLVDVSAMLAAAFSAARPVVEPLADGPSGR